MSRLLTIVMLLMTTCVAKAQFRVVDADSKQPLQSVFVLSESGRLLAMTDEKGKVNELLSGNVTLSLMSYESKTIDASSFHGDVELHEIGYDLPEVVVGRTEFVKISATFRDVVTNFDKVVVYREGLVDYYYDTKSKKYSRYVRACRQYEHPDLRKVVDSLAMEALPLLDFNKLKELEHTGASSVHGDTTIIEAKFGKKTVSDGVMTMEKNGICRSVIDALKFTDRTGYSALGMHYELKKNILDWQYSDRKRIAENLISMRQYREEEYQWSKKSVVIPITTTSDLVVNEVANLTKQEAKEEMKDKSTTTNFTLPECLPAIPTTVREQAKKLELKKFRER